VETYSTSEHLKADLGIPDDTTGSLPTELRTRAGLDAEEVEDLGETGGRRSRRRRPVRPGRSGRDRAGAAEVAEADTEDRPRRKRRAPRRRTRGGQPIEPAAGADTPPAAVEIEVSDAPVDGAGDKPARRRRRRRRGTATPEA